MKGIPPVVLLGALGVTAGLLFFTAEKERKEVERAFKRWRHEQDGIPSLDETWQAAVCWQKRRPRTEEQRRLATAARDTHVEVVKQATALIESQVKGLPPAAVGIAAVSLTRRAYPRLHKALYPPEPTRKEEA